VNAWGGMSVGILSINSRYDGLLELGKLSQLVSISSCDENINQQ
jgi:hypothetical protein